MKTLEIQLKNGENIILEVTPLLLEYIEDYEGGIEQLKKDAQGQKDKNGYTKTMYATNQLLYAIIASNYSTPLTYRQAVRLVKLEDMEKIVNFVIDNIPNTKNDNKEYTHIYRK
jgi:hypothetical protein|nr:MAG TPA: hypothetical protein [Caudoviricetes sp.]